MAECVRVFWWCFGSVRILSVGDCAHPELEG